MACAYGTKNYQMVLSGRHYTQNTLSTLPETLRATVRGLAPDANYDSAFEGSLL